MRKSRRRRWLELSRPKDTRELVVVQGKVLSCDEFKAGAEVRMARHDALPDAAFRALCNEMNRDPARRITGNTRVVRPIPQGV